MEIILITFNEFYEDLKLLNSLVHVILVFGFYYATNTFLFERTKRKNNSMQVSVKLSMLKFAIVPCSVR